MNGPSGVEWPKIIIAKKRSKNATIGIIHHILFDHKKSNRYPTMIRRVLSDWIMDTKIMLEPTKTALSSFGWKLSEIQPATG